MIYTGENEITVMLGDMEIPAIYAGDLLIYPTDFGTVTGITLEDLTWVRDVPYTGGTATSANCSYSVYAHYDSGKRRKVNNKSTVTGSLVVPATTATTREMVGTLTLTAEYEGFTATDSVDVYQKRYTNLGMPLTFEILTDGNINWKCTSTTVARTIYYSKNGGSWTPISANNGNTYISVQSGDIVEFKGDNAFYATSTSIYATFCGTTCQFNVLGNIMSLINSTDFEDLTAFTSNYALSSLFYNCTTLIDASELLLPATTLTEGCYRMMFKNCTNLVKTPTVLPATNISTAHWCYTQMFFSCTTITTPIELDATVLGSGSCDEMYRYCSELTAAPVITAPTLTYQAFSWTFANCPKLTYMKCLSTDISATRCTAGWLNYGSTTGTFVKKTGVNWPSGVSGIPNNWTVLEE